MLLDPYRASQGETVGALETLIEEARRRRIIGLAYVAMRQGGDYTVGIAGETRRSPTFTRGMLCKLDDELTQILSDLPR